MSCNSNTVTIQQANLVAGLVNFVMGRIFPPGTIVTSQVNLVTQTGTTFSSINAGTGTAQTAIPGIAVSGPVLAAAAKIEGVILAFGIAAGATTIGVGTGAIAIGLSVIAAAIAISSNAQARDVITDPELWSAIGSNNLEKWLRDNHNLNLKDIMQTLLDALAHGDLPNFRKPVDCNSNEQFTRGVTWTQPRDPLVLDLDGDGIELTQGSNSVLFDHNADGIKTGTQWVTGDDGLLVRDINGNGAIDSGRELFGDQTLLPNEQLASNGFSALAALDSNNDGVFDVNDSAYSELRVWRDLNQDGISQVEELQTLANARIESINLNTGNQNTSTFTQNGVGRTIQNVNFTTNNFYREFNSNPVITDAAAGLPQMQGAGQVRDLRESMSLGTLKATELQNALEAFKNARTAQERQSLADAVIAAWADTSSMGDARARNPVGLNTAYGNSPADAIAAFANSQPALFAQLSVLERFNAQPVVERYVRATNASYYDSAQGRWVGYTYYSVSIESQRLPFFSQAYDELKNSVYKNLYLQTEGKALVDELELVIDDNGVRLDFNALNASFSAKASVDPAGAAVALAEFLHFAGNSLETSGWDGAAQLSDLLGVVQLDASQKAAMDYLHFRMAGDVGSLNNAYLSGTETADGLIGRSGNDTLAGGGGNDILIGGAGNDALYGGAGNDQLVGGAGNDYMDGQWGNDAYFWGKGQGNDAIVDGFADTGGSNIVVLRGLTPEQVSVSLLDSQDYRAVKFTINETGETLTFSNPNFYYWNQGAEAGVTFQFADGTQWDMKEAVRQTLPMGTDGDDTLVGTDFDDIPNRLNGGKGNDLIVGQGGADVIEGGEGNDVLYGNAWLSDDGINPIRWYVDASRGGNDSDVYIFGRGDGQDTITDLDYSQNTDVLRFKPGTSAADLIVAQRGDNLVVQINGSTDTVTITNFFRPTYYGWYSQATRFSYAIESFEFSGEAAWNFEQIKEASWKGTSADDNFGGDQRDNVMGGGLGNDTLYGFDGNDTLSGGDGDDLLDAGAGDDVLDGGAGDDTLIAGEGHDTILFGRGDGRDLLRSDEDYAKRWVDSIRGRPYSATGNNIVQLKPGVEPDDIKLVRSGNTLIIYIKGTEDALSIQDFAQTGSEYTPENSVFSLKAIQFNDGTVWGPSEIMEKVLIGDGSDEVFSGYANNEVFDGQGGNDLFNGGGGVDTYEFGHGDGNDVVQFAYNGASILQFKEGVDPSDVRVRREGDAAVFTILSTGDTVTFQAAFIPDYYEFSSTDGLRSLTQVTFKDGTTWSPADINAFAIEGTAGNDIISDVLTKGPSVLAGGAGDDLLQGTRGATTYLFNRGDGKDSIIEASYQQGRDRIIFGQDIVASDLLVSYHGEDLVIALRGTNDQLTLRAGAANLIEDVIVGGVTLSMYDIRALIPSPGEETLLGSSGEDVLIGTAASSHIQGFDGNDTLLGNEGSDQLDGGLGDDILAGGAGRDELTGGAGLNTYQFNKGDAVDAITLSPDENAVIEFGPGITKADLTVQRGLRDYNGYGIDGNYLVIGTGNNDALTLLAPDGQSFTPGSAVSLTLKFQDGTQMNLDQLVEILDDGVIGYQYSETGPELVGSAIDDEIYSTAVGAYFDGRDNNDRIFAGANALVAGGAGDDQLSGATGAVLAGQAGNDKLTTDWGASATFVFNLGDGRDTVSSSQLTQTVSFGVGITPSSLRVWIDRYSGDLVFSIDGNENDEVRTPWLNPEHMQAGSGAACIQYVQFVDADGAYQQFALGALLNDIPSLLAEDAASAQAVFSTHPELRMTGTRPVFGGAAAIAYAQTGDLRGNTNIIANADLDGNNLLFGTKSDDTISAGAGNDVVLADDGNDYVWGGSGDDYLDGQAGNDDINGGDGDDVMYGGAGNDVFNPGAGNDSAYGGSGNDTYNFYRGKGRLYIEDGPESSGGDGGYGGYGGEGGYGGSGESTPTNVLVFGPGITFSDLTFTDDNGRLQVTIAGAPGDVITFSSFDPSRSTFTSSVDRFVFQDGSEVDLRDFFSSGSGHLLKTGDGWVQGSYTNDEVRGGDGNDQLSGGYGNDRLVGGGGDDVYVMSEYEGDDTIVDNANSHNTIYFQSWISPEDVRLVFENGVAKLLTPGTSITLEGWSGQSAEDAPVSQLLFSNGQSISMADFMARDRTIRGTVNDDILVGSGGNDTFDALPGNDAMSGGAGADTYLIRPGSRNDTISDASVLGQENTLVFTNITNPDRVSFSVSTDGHMVVNLGGGNTVTLVEFDRKAPEGTHTIEFFQFGENGPVLTYAQMLERGFVIDGTHSNDVLLTTSLHDVVDAGAGNDHIEGSTGSDVLSGGAGNDSYEYRMGDGKVTINDIADGTGGNTLTFGAGITPETIERKLRFEEVANDPGSSRFLIVFDENNQVSISGFDRNDPLNSPHGIENFVFADGTVLSWNEMLDKVFVLEGNEASDTLQGTSRSDRLYGYAGDDVLVAGAGDDVVTGGTGADQLSGGDGQDNYVFHLGDGQDSIQDASIGNHLTFGEGIDAGSISVVREGNDLRLNYGVSGDSILIQSTNGVPVAVNTFSEIELHDGTLLDFASFLNRAPSVGTALGDQLGRVGAPLQFTLDGQAFSDPDGDPLQWVVVGANNQALPSWLSFDPQTKTLTGTPPVGAQGIYDLSVYAVDPSGMAVSQTFKLDVTGGNAVPVLSEDGAAVVEDQVLVASGNVLSNDTDADSTDSLTVLNVGVKTGQWGSLTLAADGSYQYVLNNADAQVQALKKGVTVVDTFVYTATDGTQSVSSQLVVTVTGTNDAPVVVAQSAEITEDTVASLMGNVLSTASDVDGDSLTVVGAGTLQGQYGQLVLQQNGSYAYTLNANSTAVQSLQQSQHVTDVFSIVVSDGTTSTSSQLVIGVNGLNDGPVAIGETAAVSEDQVVSANGNVLSNDSDPDAGDSLSVVGVGTKVGQWGTLTLGADGSYQYVLNNSDAKVQKLKSGETVIDTFSYTVSDGIAQSTAQLAVSVTGTNDAPVVLAQTAEVEEDGTVNLTGNFLTTASDVDGDSLTVASAGTLQGQYGQLVLQQNGSYVYTLNNGSAAVQSLQQNQRVTDVFAITVSDGTTTTASQLVIGVNGRNDGPVALGDVAAVKEDQNLTANGNVLSNDKDVDTGDVLSVVGASVKVGQWGTLTLNADGSYQYVLDNTSTSVQQLKAGVIVVDTFSYTVTDGIAQTTSQLVVSVTGTNDAPRVTSQTAEIQEDSAANVTGNVLTTASDVDGDALTVVGAGTLQGQYGQLVLQQNGSYAYTLNNGSAAVQALQQNQRVTEVFSFAVSDGTATTTSQLVIGVNGVNDGPVARNDAATVIEDVQPSVTGSVLGNDTDADAGAQLSVTTAGTFNGTYGTLTLLANGSYTYTLRNAANVQALAPGQVVKETFAYTVSDGQAQAAANLVVSVTGQNDGPVANVDTASVSEDTAVQANGNVLLNDTDVDTGTTLVVNTVGTFQGQYGSLVLRADGSYTYSLNNTASAVQSLAKGEQVTDTFNYGINDGSGAANAAAQSSLVITVTGTNDGPVLSQAIADSSVVALTAFTLDLSDTTFRDVDHNDLLGYSLTLENGQAVPSWLTFNANGLIVSGTPPQSMAGQTVSLRLTAVDRYGASANDVFQITVSSAQGVTLVGGRGNDKLVGTNLNDSLDGRQGADTMIGGNGDDIYYVDQAANDCEAGDVVTEYLNQGYDKVLSSVSYTLTQNVEALQLTGCDNLSGTGNTLDNWIVGNTGSNVLDGKEGNDLITASSGNDCLYGGLGNDILEGQDGNDTLEGGDGVDALFGGAGTDVLRSGNGKGLLAGGKGNDTLYSANAATVVSFNKGDGTDTLYTSGNSKITLSLGGGIRYEDIKVRRSGNDLYFVFNSASTDTLRVVNYYGVSASQRPVLGMQVLTEASGAYAPSGSDTLRDNKVELFDGSRIVADFDTAYKSSSSLKSGNQWAIMGSLLNAHLSGSNTAAVGGDLAYLYGQTSGVAGVGMLAANNTLADSGFAVNSQTLNANITVPSGVARLAG